MHKRFLYTLSLGLAVSTFAMTSMMVPFDGAAAQKKSKKKEGKPAKEELSNEFIEPYNAALAAIAAKDAATVEAQLALAEPNANSNDEKFRLGNAFLQLGGLKNDTIIQRKGLELMLGTDRVAAADRPKFNFYAGNFAYAAKEYAAAESYLKQALDGGYRADNTELLYIDTIFQQDRIAEGLQVLEQAINRAQTAGETVSEDYYRRGLRRAYGAKMQNETTAWSQKWVAAYPSTTSWRDSLVLFRDSAGFGQAENVDLMRLMRATNALSSERDYAEYIENADPRRLPGEVVSVIEEGIAKGTVKANDEFFGEQLGAAKSRLAEDRGSLASGAAAARSSSNPRIAIGTADAYLGYGDYSKAIDLYSLALEKPGVDTDLVNTRIGIGNAMAGNWSVAKDSFAKVSGQRSELAKFWMIWVDNQLAGTPSAG